MSSLSHHGIKGQRWGVRRFQNADGTLTAAGRKRQQHLIEVGSGKRKRLIEAAKPIGTSRDYSRDVTGLNRRGIHGRVIDKDGNTHVIKKGTSLYRTAANPELNDDGTYASLTKNDVDRYIDYGRSGELPGADKSNLDSMKIFEFSANRDLKIANGKYITEIITDDVKRKMKNGDADQVKLGKEILESFKRYEEDLNLSFSTSEMRRSKEAYSRTEKEKEFDRDLVGKASDRLALYDKTILDYASGKDYRVIRDRLKREGYDGFIDVEDVTTIENLVRGGANTEYPVVILNANDVLTLKRSVKESETQRRLKRGTKFNSSRGELTDVVQHTSIGGTMYIEGNALILGDSSYLEHHGILGQKWGVRRFQNKDGTRTAAGKARDAENLRFSQEAKNVNTKIHSYINKQLSSEDLDTGKTNYDFASDLIKDPDFEKVIMPVVQDIRQTKAKYGNKEPYDFTGDEYQAYMNDIDRLDKKTGELAITIGLAEKGEPRKKTTPPEGEYERVDMFRYALARYLDEHSPDGYSDEGDWIYHSSMEGTLFIEDGTLYLSHHGIRGQRWGVRRFQNRDGSLTNAGRKRLGYATKGVTQTVGKAFKAGVKAGGNAVKAVKAHHEKAEAKKKEKKKEKASKTRIGVMANKDLFTNEEIRKLNERFKLEDEMKMATLQKGVEIAKAVGTIAQNVGTMAKAYEDVTGQSLSPIKRKAAEEKAKQDAEDRKRKLAKEDAETKRAEDKEKRDIEDRERRIKLEDEDRVRKQAKEDADAQRAENAEKRAQAKEQRDSSMAVELQRKAKAAADEQEHKAVKAKAESRSAILDVLEKIDKIQDHDDDDHNNPPGGGIDTWDDDDYLNFFKKTGIIHSDISDPSIIQNGVLFIDSSDSLAHHGVKGQRWGVRKFQNADGSLTEKGRKHYEKAIAKEKRKQVSSDAIRGTLERQHPFAVTGAAIMGAVAAGMSIAATGGASVAMIAAGSAISAAVSAGLTHVSYSASEAWEGRGTRMRSKKIDKYENILKQSDGENGMYRVENGALFINAGEPYLEHHGVKGMKWGKHLMAGKGEAGAGGGGGEDDEKLKEMAKKAGMSVAEYRQKFASKLGSAAGKVGEKSAKEKKRLQTYTSAEAKRISVKDKHLVINGNRFSGTRSLAVGETGEKPKSFKEKAYNALGGKYKTQAAEAHREMVQKRNDADDKARRANAQGRAANANKKAGNVREYMANKEGARQLDSEAKGARLSQWEATKKANRAQWKYDHSIAGLYDKATGKYKQAHKKTTIPKMVDRFKYEYKDGPNSKLFKNGKGKAKTAKEQAKAEVWNAADHQIKAKDYNYMANTLGGNANYYGRAFKDTAAKEARLAEGSYRRAAALGKQASSETSTSSRPRARKKKYTSGGSGVTVRRPGRKPVSRTKRVTQSSTGVKRRGSTGTGRTVQRGA